MLLSEAWLEDYDYDYVSFESILIILHEIYTLLKSNATRL